MGFKVDSNLIMYRCYEVAVQLVMALIRLKLLVSGDYYWLEWANDRFVVEHEHYWLNWMQSVGLLMKLSRSEEVRERERERER